MLKNVSLKLILNEINQFGPRERLILEAYFIAYGFHKWGIYIFDKDYKIL